MSALSSPMDLRGAIDEAHELAQVDCQGCGAPLCAGTTACAFCGRQTPYGARRARLDRLVQREALVGPSLQRAPEPVQYNEQAFPWVNGIGK